MKNLPLDLFRKGGKLRLPFGVGSGDDQAILLVKDADTALPVKIELAERLSVYHARERHDPRACLANSRRNAHLVGIVRLVLRDGFGAPLVIVQRALRQPPQCVQGQTPVLPLRIHAGQVVGMEKAGQKLGVPAAVWKIGETEMSPRVNSPIAVAVVDDLHRSAVGISKVLVKVGGASQGLERRRVVRVLPVKRHLRGGHIVIARSGTCPTMFAPVSAGSLFLSSEAMQHPAAQLYSIIVPKHMPGKQQQLGPLRIVIWR